MSKDTWVLASQPETPTGYWLRSGPAVAAVPPGASMSTRAARTCSGSDGMPSGPRTWFDSSGVINDRRNEFEHGTNPAGTTCERVLLRP